MGEKRRRISENIIKDTVFAENIECLNTVSLEVMVLWPEP